MVCHIDKFKFEGTWRSEISFEVVFPEIDSKSLGLAKGINECRYLTLG